MEKKRSMTIFFTDGRDLKFNFPKQKDDTSNIGAMIKEAMNQNQLISIKCALGHSHNTY